jgi:hypothetical protein
MKNIFLVAAFSSFLIIACNEAAVGIPPTNSSGLAEGESSSSIDPLLDPSINPDLPPIIPGTPMVSCHTNELNLCIEAPAGTPDAIEIQDMCGAESAEEVYSESGCQSGATFICPVAEVYPEGRFYIYPNSIDITNCDMLGSQSSETTSVEVVQPIDPIPTDPINPEVLPPLTNVVSCTSPGLYCGQADAGTLAAAQLQSDCASEDITEVWSSEPCAVPANLTCVVPDQPTAQMFLYDEMFGSMTCDELFGSTL